MAWSFIFEAFGPGVGHALRVAEGPMPLEQAVCGELTLAEIA
jgi:hypothetical protein